jgi:protein SCO1/2
MRTGMKIKVTRNQIVILVVAYLSLVGLSVTSTASTQPPVNPMANASAAPMGGTYFSLSVPKDVLSTTLFDSHGAAFTLNNFKGKFVVLAPFLTSCQEICPMTSADLRSVASAISTSGMSNQAKVLELSVDSARDIPSRLRAYQALFGDNSWTIAGGSTSNLAKLWKFFGVYASKSPYSASDLKNLPVDWQTGKKNTYDISHTDLVAIITPDQKWAWLDLGSPDIGKNSLPNKLKAFLDGAGLKNLVKPEQPTWTVLAVTSALSHLMGMKIG